MVDRVIESSEFAHEIRRVKVACVAAGIETGKEVAQGCLASGDPGLS